MPQVEPTRMAERNSRKRDAPTKLKNAKRQQLSCELLTSYISDILLLWRVLLRYCLYDFLISVITAIVKLISPATSKHFSNYSRTPKIPKHKIVIRAGKSMYRCHSAPPPSSKSKFIVTHWS